ncbi:SlyX protein [Pseudolabrys sp. Root1462]|uniref:SlyX family protein n=1 Tax=Pseudolabrys sp. Root1462 TaxID=1736466 RepID=UPI000702F9DD|nr:SlyX family protein [Pseudolabrys sp. Root1462]KQZ01728.1 SlyX protein [Pseudolabrys sp. Root1462]
MDDLAALNARLVALETDRSHQERAIEDLSEAVTEQWKLIDQLKRQVERLADQVREAAIAAPGEPEPPPPHY